MLIYVLDSEYEVLKSIDDIISTYPICSLKLFTKEKQLIDAIIAKAPDVILIDGDDISCVKTIKAIMELDRNIRLIMLSKNEKKALDAFELGSFGFILKPISKDKIENQIFQIKHPLISKLVYMKERLVINESKGI